MIERDPEKDRSQLPYQLAATKPRRVLPAAEWVWRDKRRFPKSNEELCAARFVLGEEPSELTGVDEAANVSGTNRDQLPVARADDKCTGDVAQREIVARDGAFQTRLRGWLLTK